MATTPTTPTTPATPAASGTPATPAPVTAPPPPKPPTPLDPPAVYYNQKWRVPPLIVDTQEQADALDPAEWTTGSPPKAPASTDGTKSQDQYPQLYANVNLPPKIVGSKADAAALGDEWKQFDLPDALCKAAEAQNAAKTNAAAAKDQTQTQGQGQSAAQNAPTQQTQGQDQSQSQGQTPPQTPPQQTWNPQTGWSG